MKEREQPISVVGIQTAPTMDKAANLKQAFELMDQALTSYKYVDVIVLPEYFYYAPSNKEADQVGPIPQEIIDGMASRARFYGTYVIAGSIANRREDGKNYNTSLLFDREGSIVASYDKIHLFDALNAMGGEQESDLVARGDHQCIYDCDFGRIAIGICYDVRFPEMARTLALKGVEYYFMPAAFYMPRFDHWTDLLRTTALHNSMYVLGCNLYGEMDPDNVFCGRSLIADPWGAAIAQASDKACYIQAYLDPEYPGQIRDRVGSLHNRVPSVYHIPDIGTGSGGY